MSRFSSCAFGLVLAALSNSAFAAPVETLYCNGADNNGQVSQCVPRTNAKISDIRVIDEFPVHQSSRTVIPCVNEQFFSNYSIDPSGKSISAWGGCNANFEVSFAPSVVLKTADLGCPLQNNSTTCPWPAQVQGRVKSITITREYSVNKCFPGKTWAQDANRRVILVNGGCQANFRFEYYVAQ
jgi:hypothetical protein